MALPKQTTTLKKLEQFERYTTMADAKSCDSDPDGPDPVPSDSSAPAAAPEELPYYTRCPEGNNWVSLDTHWKKLRPYSKTVYSKQMCNSNGNMGLWPWRHCYTTYNPCIDLGFCFLHSKKKILVHLCRYNIRLGGLPEGTEGKDPLHRGLKLPLKTLLDLISSHLSLVLNECKGSL